MGRSWDAPGIARTLQCTHLLGQSWDISGTHSRTAGKIVLLLSGDWENHAQLMRIKM